MNLPAQFRTWNKFSVLDIIKNLKSKITLTNDKYLHEDETNYKTFNEPVIFTESSYTSDRLKSVARTTIHSLNLTEHIWAKRNSASSRLCNVPIWSWECKNNKPYKFSGAI